MTRALVLALLALASAAAAQERLSPRAKAWWNDIKVIAADRTEGRQTGSRGYLRAARYVEARFKALGLQPAGEHGGYRQSVAFEEQVVDQKASLVWLGHKNQDHPGHLLQEDLLISAGGARRPDSVAAPLVFIGYGLHLPEWGYDDFAGVDLKGKIAVVLSGGPASLPGPLKAANRNERAKLLAAAGAVGLISLTTPKQVEIPWARAKLLASQPGMYLADKSLRETPDGFFVASFNPEKSAQLFEGSGHNYAELVSLADASRPLPRFDLEPVIRGEIVAKRRPLTSPNLIAVLPGSDPKLRLEYVVVSAHLDHLGIRDAAPDVAATLASAHRPKGAPTPKPEPIPSDRIYHGAMDDASGVASVLDIAQRLEHGPRPKRSILFVIVTAEEKGLLGSRYFAEHPTVPKGSIVADLNFDMPLPLWPLKTVLVQGEAESTLGDVARDVAARQGLALTPDPLPDRNSFVRTDQFSFVKAGVPALAFKFGFAKGTPEFQIEHDWRAHRYHDPSDDLSQPGVLKGEAVRLDDYVAAIVREVADRPERPAWLETSPFRRYARKP
jgi:Zn-dependent M28 family amino/carboxypeptidase